MSDLLESELRTAFAARLETLSPEREARLCVNRNRKGRQFQEPKSAPPGVVWN